MAARFDDLGIVVPSTTYYMPEGTPRIRGNLADATGGVVGIWLNSDRDFTNYFNPFKVAYPDGLDDGAGAFVDGLLPLSRQVPSGTSHLWANYYQLGNYRIDRTNAKVVFNAADAGRTVRATYAFGTKMKDAIGNDILIGANTAPTLSDARLTPKTGSRSTMFTYTVTYRDLDGSNGQPPDYVRVVIDGTPYNMAPANPQGTPAYREGAVYTYATSGLLGGNHKYYFETSDGAAIAWLDANGVHNKDLGNTSAAIVPLNGPWVNGPPELSGGLASPNPAGGNINTGQSVDYTVVYTDPDGDAPYFYNAATDGQLGANVSGSPRVWIDSGTTDVSYTGKVVDLEADPLDPTKMRTIVALTLDGEAPEWTPDQFAGKLMQITNGALVNRVYLIQSNTADTLVIGTDNLQTDGIVTTAGSESTFRINGLLMSKANEAQQDYKLGITYKLTVPKLAVGTHKFHFTARSRVTKPAWLLAEETAAGIISNPYSSEVRNPTTGDYTGPTVNSAPPQNNSAPVLSSTAATSLYNGPYAKAADVVTTTSVRLNTSANWTLPEAQGVREILGVYMNATLATNANVGVTNYLTAPVTTIPATYVIPLNTALVAPGGAVDLVQFGTIGASLLSVTPDSAPSIGSISGVYTSATLTGTNYFGSFNGTTITVSTPLPSGTTQVYIKYRLKDGVTYPPVYAHYFKSTPANFFLSGQPITFRTKYRDADNDPPTYHDGVQGYVKLVFDNVGAPRPMVLLNAVGGALDYTQDVPFTLTVTDTPEGQNNYHFEGSDGYDPAHLVRWPLASGDLSAYSVKVNYRPKLTLGKVDPVAGLAATTFTFSVRYTDTDGGAASAPTPSVRLRLIKTGANPVEAVYTMTAAANPVYANGVDYTYQISGLTSGTYTVAFEASDGYQYAVPFSALNLLVRDTNDAPVIVDHSVTPAAGKRTQSFVYSAHYRDPNGDPPIAILGTQRSEGLILVIDKGTSREKKVVMTKVLTPGVNPDYTSAEGVLYKTVTGVTGSSLGTGQHSYEIQASDGTLSAAPVSASSVPVVLVPFFDELRAVSASAAVPESAAAVHNAGVGDQVLVQGLMKFPKNAVTGKPAAIDDLSIQITKPDGTAISLAATVAMLADDADTNNWVGRIRVSSYPSGVDPALVTGTSVTLSSSGEWVFSASWPGDVKWDSALTDSTIDNHNDIFTTQVGGPLRTLAVREPVSPATSTPLVDMVTPAMVIGSGDVGAIFGYDRAALMQIVRWDPLTSIYFRYGSGTFPTLVPGHAVWMKPKSDYPAEAIYLTDIESGLLSSGNASSLLDISKQYRLMKTFSKAYPTQANATTGATELAPCVIPLYRGWNQFGNIFFNWKKDAAGVALTPREDLGLPFKDIKVRYLNQELSIADAKLANWIRDYAWRYDPEQRQYVLVSGSASGAERVLKAWSGYWIRALVDCDLVINPNTTYNGGTLGAASVMGAESAEELDEPPAIPR